MCTVHSIECFSHVTSNLPRVELPTPMFARKLPALALAVSLLLIGTVGCVDWLRDLLPIACTEEFRYGLSGTVTDPDGEAIENVTVTITDGDYEEDAMFLSDTEYVGAGEREGTYTITVEAPGYETATLENVEVTADECHVIGKVRNFVLNPL